MPLYEVQIKKDKDQSSYTFAEEDYTLTKVCSKNGMTHAVIAIRKYGEKARICSFSSSPKNCHKKADYYNSIPHIMSFYYVTDLVKQIKIPKPVKYIAPICDCCGQKIYNRTKKLPTTT